MTMHLKAKPVADATPEVDAREPVARLLRDLRTDVTGLTARLVPTTASNLASCNMFTLPRTYNCSGGS